MSDLEFIYKRKSIRQFKEEEVPKEDILKLLDAASHAPSPKHQQNWHFVVLQNREMINKMADLVAKRHEEIGNQAKVEKEYKQFMSVMSYYTCFKDAPVVIMVYGTPYRMIEEKILKDNAIGEEIIAEIKSTQSGAQAIGAAVENLLLAATDMGYGTCYLTGPSHAKKEIEALIGFNKEGYTLMSMVALGVPAENTPTQPPRKPLEEIVTFIN